MYQLKPKRPSDGLLVCLHMLKHADVKHTQTQVNKLLEDHLDHPSLLSIKDVLSEYGMESLAIRKGKHSYHDFETPFICSIQQEDWPLPAFTVVSHCTADLVTYLDPISRKEKTCALDAFEQIDKEILLLLDGEHTKDEVDYTTNRQTEITGHFIAQLPLYAVSIAVIVSLIFQLTSDVSWISPAFLLTSTAGLLISLLLVWHEVDAHNPFIREVCGGNKGSKLNCNAVLSSTGAHFRGISWSVWGFAYFGTFFLSQAIFSGQTAYTGLWSLLSIAALLYVPYSIYYQAKVVKQWCPLCLAVQALIGINTLLAIIFCYQNTGSLTIPPQTVFNVFFLGLSLLLLTYYAVPLLKKAREARNYEKRWKRLRFNPDIFLSLLQKSTAVTASPEGLGVLVGNPDASTEIIKVCNPYCGPCSKAHPELEQIIKNNSDVRLRIIFTANGEENDIRTPPVTHLLAIQEKQGRELVQQALDDWYLAPVKDYEAFSEKYPLNGELKQQQDKIYAMRDWCTAMKIRATPTIFINGQELPDSYRIAELKNFF